MASLSCSADGNKRIRFRSVDGRRVSIRLGRLEKRQAETVRNYVSRLETAKQLGEPADADVQRWLGRISDTLHQKLAHVGLVMKRELATLGSFLRMILDERKDLKPNTRKNWQSTIKHLVDYFGGETNLRDISSGEADQFRQWMVNQGLSDSTVSREVKRARQFFRVALRRKLLSENPFADIATPAQVNPDRQHYVTLKDTKLLLNECRSPSKQLIIALARFTGLRIPSELVGLRWSEVNWERERFVVHAPKTERHGKGTRVVPIFTDLAPFFRRAY